MGEAGPAQRLGPLHRLIGLAQLGLFATVLYSVEKMGYGPRPSSALVICIYAKIRCTNYSYSL